MPKAKCVTNFMGRNCFEEVFTKRNHHLLSAEAFEFLDEVQNRAGLEEIQIETFGPEVTSMAFKRACELTCTELAGFEGTPEP